MNFIPFQEQFKRWRFSLKVFCRGLDHSDRVKIIKYCFLRYILRVVRPVSVVFALTYRCQCRCVHCSVGAYKKASGDELSSGEVKELLAFLSRYGIFKVTFFGGEPFLREDLFELLEYANSVHQRISIDTNGLMLTPERVRRLKELRISNINISLDSAEPLVHDKLRGIDGCFAAAVNGIKLCVEAGIPCLVSTYASKRAIASGDLKRLIGLSRTLGASGVKILLPIISGKWLCSVEEKLSLQEEEMVREIADPSFVYIEDALSMLRNSSKRCSSLDKNFFYISPFGDIQLCPAIPVSFGNLRQEKLDIILKRMWDHRISKTKCRGCLMNDEGFRRRFPVLWQEKAQLPIDAHKI